MVSEKIDKSDREEDPVETSPQSEQRTSGNLRLGSDGLG